MPQWFFECRRPDRSLFYSAITPSCRFASMRADHPRCRFTEFLRYSHVAKVALVCFLVVPQCVFADGEKLSGTVVDARKKPVKDAIVYFCDHDPRTANRQELRIQVSPADTVAKNVRLQLPINTDIVFESKGDDAADRMRNYDWKD